MGKKVEIDIDDLMRVCNILDSLRVSLDRIGAIVNQGRDKMRLAFDEYFTSVNPKTGKAVYHEIADCWELLARLLDKELGQEEFLNRTRQKTIPYFELKKYD